MKKMIAAVLLLTVIVSLSACGHVKAGAETETLLTRDEAISLALADAQEDAGAAGSVAGPGGQARRKSQGCAAQHQQERSRQGEGREKPHHPREPQGERGPQTRHPEPQPPGRLRQGQQRRTGGNGQEQQHPSEDRQVLCCQRHGGKHR